jgi:hypothetical protein
MVGEQQLWQEPKQQPEQCSRMQQGSQGTNVGHGRGIAGLEHWLWQQADNGRSNSAVTKDLQHKPLTCFAFDGQSVVLAIRLVV